MTPAGFPHSDISGCYGCTRLTGAFRSVPRPSSAQDAKASTVCPYSLKPCDTEKLMLSRYFAMRLVSCVPTAVGGSGISCPVSACEPQLAPTHPATIPPDKNSPVYLPGLREN